MNTMNNKSINISILKTCNTCNRINVHSFTFKRPLEMLEKL